MQFAGKTILITGASSGIGRACARRFAQLGSKLVLTARSADLLDKLAAELAPVETHAIPADLTETASIAQLCDQALGRCGKIDILINCAGVGLYAPASKSDPEKVRYLMALNLLAPVELIRRLSPTMTAGSAIVNISSIGGKVPLPWLSVYTASKYALNGYSDALRTEVQSRGIQVLSMCPGFVETSFRENVLQGRIPALVAAQKRFLITAEQCADEVVEGLRAGKRTVVTPRIGWLLVLVARLFPAIVYGRMGRMRRTEDGGAG